MDGKYSHWLSGKLSWVKRKPPLLQNEFSLFKSCRGLLCAARHINCISRFKCGIVSLVTVFNTLNVQHLPQSSPSSLAVLKQCSVK